MKILSDPRQTTTRILLILILDFVIADDPDRLPTKCETCKYLTNEISESLLSHNSFEVIQTGYNIDERLNKKNPKKYIDSEIRLIEVLESVCERILDYHVHAERKGSLRYAKGESQTMQSLKDLRKRGVKVELGIPEDLWDVPSAEITQLKKYCDNMVELYEEEIENWYTNERKNISLTNYLCERVILKNQDKSCLEEVFVPKPKDEEETQETKKSKKKKVEDSETEKQPLESKEEL